jgi:flavin reductase (DIM6/NTAB) family NADH-FMN oxidoreductase RutF
MGIVRLCRAVQLAGALSFQSDWKEGISGAPLIRDITAWVEGPIINRMSAGDHEGFLIAVRDGGSGPRQGRFMLSDPRTSTQGHP